jgi:hypothetical protein
LVGLPAGRDHSRQGQRVSTVEKHRLPVEAITGGYDAFRHEGLSHEAAVAETLDCYPEAGIAAIEAILRYRTQHQLQARLEGLL